MQNNNINLFLALILSCCILFVWQTFFAPEQAVPHFTTQPVVQSVETAKDLHVAPEVNKQKSRSFLFRNDSMSGTIEESSGRISSITLRHYEETIAKDSPKVQIFSEGKHPYFAETGWFHASTSLPDEKSKWVYKDHVLTPEHPLVLSWRNKENILFTKTYTIDHDYMIQVKETVLNEGDKPISMGSYALITRKGTPETSNFFVLHEGMIGFGNNNLQEITYKDIVKKQTISANSPTGGWLGFTDKYWFSGLSTLNPEPLTLTFRSLHEVAQEVYQTDLTTPVTTILPHTSQSITFLVFAGPKENVLLDHYAQQYNISHFDRFVDFGHLYFLTKPTFYALTWLYHHLHNFGLAILSLTILIKILLFPMALKSYDSMGKMRLLAPKMAELKEQYKNDKQKINEAIMDLYKKEKINPLAGCLPILLQIPIFFALYKVIFITIEMRHQPFYGWIQDLSAPDPYGIFHLFGLVDWTIPSQLEPFNIGLWPILMGLSIWAQQKLNPTNPTEELSRKLFLLVPIVFTFFSRSFPAGLVIYWTWNNVLSIIQQSIIMNRAKLQGHYQLLRNRGKKRGKS